MARLLALLLLWVAQATLIVLLVNAEWVQQQSSVEQHRITKHMGVQRSAAMIERAQARYQDWFSATGIRQQTYRRLLPDPSLPRTGVEGLAPWFFDWLKRRLDAFWALVFLGICRAHLFVEWAPLLMAAGAAAIIDGVVQRRIKRFNHALASADKYVLAKCALMVLTFVPLLYLSAPIAITPLIVPGWGACLTLTCMLLASHAQHRI